jgi:AcrR family transcriptional regulator
MRRKSEKTPSKKPRRTKRLLGRRPKANGGDQTRNAILDSAESLFAEHGLDGVTVREITKAAGVDVALAHYYFETKRGLFDAVFMRRAKILNDARMASIDAYEEDPGPEGATVEGLINAFLAPVLERWANGGAGWKSYLALVALVNNTTKWGGETMSRSFDPVIERLIAGLRRALPGATDDDLYWSYHFLSGALTLTMAETGRLDRLSGGKCKSSDAVAASSRMPAYAAAGFRMLCVPAKEGPAKQGHPTRRGARS